MKKMTFKTKAQWEKAMTKAVDALRQEIADATDETGEVDFDFTTLEPIQ